MLFVVESRKEKKINIFSFFAGQKIAKKKRFKEPRIRVRLRTSTSSSRADHPLQHVTRGDGDVQ